MKKFEVEKIVSKSIIITVILLALVLGMEMANNAYFNHLTFNTAKVTTLVASILFAVIAVALVVVGVVLETLQKQKGSKYYVYASLSAFIAIFAMLLKINYEIKGLEFMIGARTIKFYMMAMVVFAVMIIFTWARAIVKIVRN